jgi:hypothetical protein
MAIREVAVTDTLETFRTEFNALARDDFGDIATLSGVGISSTSVVGAINEIAAIVASARSFIIEDASSTIQILGDGETLRFLGSANQINAVVSSPDTVTFSLTNDVTIANDLTVTNDLTVSNDLSITNDLTTTGTSNLGSVVISGNSITVSDSSTLSFGTENLSTTGSITGGTGNFTSISSSGAISGTTITGTGAITGTTLNINSSIVFEGSTADDFETTLTVTNPTADRTITIPNVSGTVVTTGDTSSVSTTMIANNAITIDKMADDAIGSSELKDVVNLQILDSTGSQLKIIYGAGS